MRHFSDISSLKNRLHELRANEKSVGLVPTMGALHSGHSSLVKASLKENDVTVTSIYVNPAQFDNESDFHSYPETLENDLNMLQALGNSIVFTPSNDEMYPDKPILKLDFGYIENEMEGKFRPGHFNGVGIVVAKLLNIVKPDRAYFGQKDLQQYAIINRVVKDFSFDVELRCIPIVRESSGLALSSRNMRLNSRELEEAIIFYRALILGKELIKTGMPLPTVTAEVQNLFANSPVTLEYFETVHPTSLQKISEYNSETTIALCIAGYVGKVRLIDNMIIGK